MAARNTMGQDGILEKGPTFTASTPTHDYHRQCDSLPTQDVAGHHLTDTSSVLERPKNQRGIHAYSMEEEQ